MKALYLLSTIYVALIVSGCTNIEAPASKEPPQQEAMLETHDPLKVSIISPAKKLNVPYQVLGKASVSQYNTVGHKRQQAVIDDMLRQLAAGMNGDAVIDMKKHKSTVTATIVAYKKVLA